MEEDFLTWKDPMWTALAETKGLEEREVVYGPVFATTEQEVLTKDSPEVYLGEPNKMHRRYRERSFQFPSSIRRANNRIP
jgi:NADPH-ferrihemoprotein reductase